MKKSPYLLLPVLFAFFLLSAKPVYSEDIKAVINAPTDGFSIINNGNETVARFLGDGTVGIGTTSPSALLHIEGSSTVSNALKVNGSVTVTTGNVAIGTTTFSSSILTLDGLSTLATQTLVVNGTMTVSAGNVGIGTTTPSAKFVVGGSFLVDSFGSMTASVIKSIGSITVNTKDPAIILDGSTPGDTDFWVGAIADEGGDDNDLFQIGTGTSAGSNAALTIDQDGSVGIGTITPVSRLEIKGSSTSVSDSSFNVTDSGGSSLLKVMNDGTVTVSGFIGMGTTTVGDRAHINNGALMITSSGATTDPILTGLRLGGHSAYSWIQSYNAGLVLNPLAQNVGIGDTTPTEGTLVIRGNPSYNPSDDGHGETYGYLADSGGSSHGNNSTTNGAFAYSIWAEDRVAADEFNAYSDKRIKKIKGISNSADDLKALNRIEITDYSYIDVIGKGDGKCKKVIGQQIQQVYPQAAHTTSDFIPNVYELCEKALYNEPDKQIKITTSKPHDFNVGDMVRVIDDNGMRETKALSVDSEYTFTINSDKKIEKIFVYGKRVNDFLVVDYEAIAMLNVSATHQLYKNVKRLEAENIELKKIIKEIKNDNVALKELKREFQEVKEIFKLLPKGDIREASYTEFPTVNE